MKEGEEERKKVEVEEAEGSKAEKRNADTVRAPEVKRRGRRP